VQLAPTADRWARGRAPGAPIDLEFVTIDILFAPLA
jgi:hypothetical protein